MKKTILLLSSLLGLMALQGCDEDNPVYDPGPARPQSVYSVTGDHEVTVYWNRVLESDIDYYIVYRSLDSITDYTEVGRVSASPFPAAGDPYGFVDQSLTNGTTYYFAVSTVDRAGHESDLSFETVFDTPRPEGEVILYPYQLDANVAGFNLEGQARVAWNSATADVYVDSLFGISYLNAANASTDIQDMGYTASFDEIGYSPDDGWSELGYVEIILGHTYIIWTDTYNYAKMRVKTVSPSGAITFQWAFQTTPDNRELIAPPPGSMQKPQHGPDYLAKGRSVSAAE